MNKDFAIDLGQSTVYRMERKRGRIHVGFDARMMGMGSREDVLAHLDILMEEWQKRNPDLTPTEVVDDIKSRCSLVTGGTTYDGFRSFEPVKRKERGAQ